MKQFCGAYLFVVIFLASFSTISAQTSDKLWHKKNAFEVDSYSKIERRTIPKEFKVYNLDINSLKQQLQNAPKRKGKSLRSSTILSFPSASGELEKYEVFEASIMEKGLQEKFPTIKSYVGKSVENPGTTIRFSVSNIGLHAMIMGSEKGSIYVDPYTKNKELYIIYSKSNLPSIDRFECHVEDLGLKSKSGIALKSENADDSKLRTFRLAIATTGEYSQFQLMYNGIASSATVEEKKATVMAAINATMTRVNGIYERDVALTMELVSNNEDIIFFDSVTDGFTNDDGNLLINESQEKIDAIIGDTNYDIGHTFSTGGGGLALLNSPCIAGSKAKGITGSSYPIGDTYDVDFVAHEMGHQYGANHTFNSEEGTCGNNNRNDDTAVEPGSGSTIMAYAGLCAPDNVQQYGDDYFHLVSIQEMWANISAGNSTCADQKAIANTPPDVDELVSYTLPVSTPFALEAIAIDAATDVLTYTWEQLDSEEAVVPLVATSTEGPSFRSLGPSISPIRYFPNQETVIAGNLFNDWEVLTSVSRTMNFGVNVRDNNINGGQTASKETTLTFDASSGPFKVSSQTTTESWNASDIKTINWDVANTNVAPVNCATINILLSTDGGYTFPITLASGVTNNGTYDITVPDNTTDLGRIKIESVNNIFYAINDANISIQAKEYTMTFSQDSVAVCKPTNAVYNFTYNTALSFNEETTFSATELPAGASVSFSPSKATANGTAVAMTISGMSAVDLGIYDITVTGTSDVTSMVKIEPVVLEVYNSTLVVPILLSPADGITEFVKPYKLEWEVDTNSVEYIVQLSTNSDFSSVLEESTVEENSFLPQNLIVNTLYYWRVKGKNSCGESGYSSVFNFTTANETCDVYSSSDTPKNIPDDNSEGVNSIINVSQPKTVTKVVVEVNISHSYVSDLALTLISPNGISILLSVSNGSDGNNYTNTTFDDDAAVSIGDASPPFTGTFIPEIPLDYVNGIESSGNWVLNVVDSGVADTGTITSWDLQICGIPIVIIDDEDNDGVKDNKDLCLGTTAGAMVDDVGCFILATDNFNIQTLGATCPDKSNGQILISTENSSYNYSAVIDGKTISFSNSKEINDLAAGTYDFCISVDGESYEQCYSVVIEDGIKLEAKSTINKNKAAVEISKGTAPYTIIVSGKELFSTNDTSFDVDVVHGDLLEVKSAIECEGVFSKEMDLINEIIAFPNPSYGSFEIGMPIAKKEVVIELYNMQSQLISSKLYQVNSGKVQLNIEDQSTGIYIAKVLLDKPVALKIIKQ